MIQNETINETIRSLASRAGSLATRAGLYHEPPPSPRGREMTMLALAAGAGALAMYLFDPQEGRRRRALVRDQLTSALTRTERRVEAKARHWRNRMQGVASEVQSAVTERRSA